MSFWRHWWRHYALKLFYFTSIWFYLSFEFNVNKVIRLGLKLIFLELWRHWWRHNYSHVPKTFYLDSPHLYLSYEPNVDTVEWGLKIMVVICTVTSLWRHSEKPSRVHSLHSTDLESWHGYYLGSSIKKHLYSSAGFTLKSAFGKQTNRHRIWYISKYLFKKF